MKFHHHSEICPTNTGLFNPHSEYMSKNKAKYLGVKDVTVRKNWNDFKTQTIAAVFPELNVRVPRNPLH